MKKIKERYIQVIFSRIGNRESLEVIRIGDSSYNGDKKYICGELIFMKKVNSDRESPIYYKTKQIDRVSHSSKDAETLNVTRKVDDLVFLPKQLEISV